MDQVQSLGFFGIFRESFSILSTWRNIFSKITLALIFPLSFIFLAHMEISNHIFDNIQLIDPRYYHGRLGSKWVAYILFKLAYFTFLLIFSLLSTSAVVYTIASIYTGRDVTFKKVMKVVPKVWKRLMVTFLVIYVAMFIYIVVFVLALALISMSDGTASGVLLIIVLIVFSVGFVYMTIVWQLASVVTVLEDSYGFKAMKKSKNLIKGKLWVTSIIFLMLNCVLVGVELLFMIFVVYTYNSWTSRIGFAVLCFVLLVTLILFGLVVQTIIYFVCKSFHNEAIDKPTLSNHLGEYERLNKVNDHDVQLGQV